MGGLITSLTNAARSLAAEQYGLDVTGQNIANISTDGYSRRKVTLAAVPEQSGGGVEVVGASAQRDAFLEGRLRAVQPAASQQSAIGDLLGVVQSMLGSAGESIDGDLSDFFASFGSLSLDVTSPVARDSVVRQGVQLAAAFNQLSAQLSESRRAADTRIRGGIGEINTLASQIASLNATIAGANGADVEALKDQQSVLVRSLTKLVGVGVLARSDGGVDVTIGNGRALVVGANTYDLGMGSTGIGGFTTITSHGTDITGELTGGEMKGWLEVRDTLVPGYQTSLDQLAFDVASQVNTVHQAGYDLNGNTGNNFFTPLGGVAGAAAAIAVDPAIVASNSRVAGSQTGAVGDNQTAKALAALGEARVAAGGTSTFVQAWSQMVYTVGSDAQSAHVGQKTNEDILHAVQMLRDSVSGVSLDEEAASLMTFQRGYQANARFFSTVNDVLDVLMTMIQ